MLWQFTYSSKTTVFYFHISYFLSGGGGRLRALCFISPKKERKDVRFFFSFRFMVVILNISFEAIFFEYHKVTRPEETFIRAEKTAESTENIFS